MRLVPFRSAKANGDMVWVNPETVIRVEPGSHHYNINTMPNHRTFIAQVFGGGVFVDEPIQDVIAALDMNYLETR